MHRSLVACAPRNRARLASVLIASRQHLEGPTADSRCHHVTCGKYRLVCEYLPNFRNVPNPRRKAGFSLHSTALAPFSPKTHCDKHAPTGRNGAQWNSAAIAPLLLRPDA
jgi:hypothetical protein